MKKQYNIPTTEPIILSPALLQSAHAFGEASMPTQMGIGSGNLAPKKKTEVF